MELLQINKNNEVDLPDHLEKLFHKFVMQMRFHTISGKNEILTIIHMCQISEEYFKKLWNINETKS